MKQMSETTQQRIQAAIDKLERLKAESTPGPWMLRYNVGRSTWPMIVSGGIGPVFNEPEHGSTEADNALVVTLHRTIDAQLDLLKGTAILLEGFPSLEVIHALAFADAILGEDDTE